MVNSYELRPDLLEMVFWAEELKGYLIWFSRHTTVLGDRSSIHKNTSPSNSASVSLDSGAAEE
jgi:hypothetical protein